MSPLAALLKSCGPATAGCTCLVLMPRRRSSLLYACLLLILCIVTGRGQGAGGGPPGEVYVDNSLELYAALANQSVSTVVVTSDQTLSEGDWGAAPYAPGEPLLLQRNVTIRAEPRWKLLDLRFLQQRILLAPGVTLALEDVLLRHSRWVLQLVKSAKALKPVAPPPQFCCLQQLRRQQLRLTADWARRYGSGIQMLDILAASPGSTLALSGVVSIRIACVPNAAALPRLLAAPRPPGESHTRAGPLASSSTPYGTGAWRTGQHLKLCHQQQTGQQQVLWCSCGHHASERVLGATHVGRMHISRHTCGSVLLSLLRHCQEQPNLPLPSPRACCAPVVGEVVVKACSNTAAFLQSCACATLRGNTYSLQSATCFRHPHGSDVCALFTRCRVPRPPACA